MALSSSSSSSTSSSWSSYSTSSSSSYFCCSVLSYCEGGVCSNFSSWSVSGMNYGNSDNCTLYVVFDSYGLTQKVDIYKDKDHSSLVASGEKAGLGVINFTERNSSGLSGSVTWDGTLISFPNAILLSCFEISSSSSSTSSTSIDSESTSSTSTSLTSSSMSSSSSSACCINPTCEGDGCSNFSSWLLSGSYHSNTDNCTLYIVFDNITGQEVRLYKDSSLASAYLVAAGQRANTGSISLTERNGSGLSGSVTWNGTAVTYSEAILDCDFSSSSSSQSTVSSSSSSESTSSLSSSSTSSSKSSKSSSTSSSPESRSSSSSSTSIDSHSSTSESEGNVSTSSSSSFGGWNKTKPLYLGMSAINSSTIFNRMAQTVLMEETFYEIGKVYCYFYGPYGDNTNFTIHLALYNCNDDGSPNIILSEKTLVGSNITGDGWYAFSFNSSGVLPSNKFLSFVVWQTGGDEDNYVLWGYNPVGNIINTSSWISNNAITWQEQVGVIRALKVIGSFDAYDLTNFRILTPSAEKECIVHPLSANATFDGTKFIAGSYSYAPDRVVIDYPKLFASFVVDSSGSMGWNDRFSTRQEFINKFVQRVKDNYPAEYLFDIIKFGSQISNGSSITTDIGVPVTINLDLNNPTRTTYYFSVSNATAYYGDVYGTNNVSFEVSANISSGTNLICIGSGDADIYTNGTLVRISGSGDNYIAYNSYSMATMANTFSACGFSNLEDDHNYNISTIQIGDSTTLSPEIKNWQPLSSGVDIPLSIGTSGPKKSSSLNFTPDDTLVLRKVLNGKQLQTSKIISDVIIGSNTVSVEYPSYFVEGDIIDLVDRDFLSIGYTITNVNSSVITFTPVAGYSISSWDNNGGIIQESNIKNPTSFFNTTAKLLVKDSIVTRNITFWLQTSDGQKMEWDFMAFKDWTIYNSYWLDETALFPISIFDVDGNPYPDGTKIVFYVNTPPSDSTLSNQILSTALSKDAYIGDSIVYLESANGFSIGKDIDISNDNNVVQTVEIIEVGISENGNYLGFAPSLQYNFLVSDNSVVVLSDVAIQNNNVSYSNLLAVSLNMVDVTPIYTGKNLNPSLLKNYDPSPISPSTPYSSLNLDRDHVKININDVPSIDGKVAVRVLPITEDNLKTINEKNKEVSRYMVPETPPDHSGQLEQTSGDLDKAKENIVESLGSITTTTTTDFVTRGSDYEITNPVYLIDGYAESSMSSFATNLVEKTYSGINVPGVSDSTACKLLSKSYKIYPVMTITTNNNVDLARVFLDSFEVDFICPYTIYSKYNSGKIYYTVPSYYDEPCDSILSGYTKKEINGVYAGGDGFEIEYTVVNKGELLENGTLTIRIYSNSALDITAAPSSNSSSKQDLNVILPKTSSVDSNGVTQINQPLTNISQWRSSVENNPVFQLLEDIQPSNASVEKELSSGVISKAKELLIKSGFDVEDESSDSENKFGFFTNPWQWTFATQYGDSVQEQTINVVNGRAKLVIPSSDVDSILFIQASVYFGDNDKYEVIRSDVVAVANPIDIGAITPLKIYANGGSEKYEIGCNVSWMGEKIADGISVGFIPNKTPMLPAVSKTDEGWAGGVFIGPHSIVTMTQSEFCVPVGQYEVVKISVGYLGYERIVDRIIEWTGLNSYEIKKDEQYFKVNVTNSGSSTPWANGDSSNYNVMTSDLDNDVEDILWVGSDGINRLKGFDQNPLPPQFPNGAPNKVACSARGLIVTSNQERWNNGVAKFNVYGLNQNIGYEQMTSKDDEFSENSPWQINTKITSMYTYNDEYGKRKSRNLIGVVREPYIGGDLNLIIPYPMSNFREPLGISISMEAYDGELIRNGIDSPNIIADVTWEDAPIKSKFTKNRGQLSETEIDYPFPNVTFEAGTKGSGNSWSDGEVSYYVDTRNTLAGALTIDGHQDVKLNSYVATVSLSRTDIYVDGDGSHTHACYVDSDGNGFTNSTIPLSGIRAENHIHLISDYIAQNSGSPSHTHNLRSVAIVKLNPISNPNVNIAINGYVVYDPTNCTPYEQCDLCQSSPHKSVFSDGNRMMFATLYLNSQVINRQLIVDIEQIPSIFTSKTITNTDRAFNVVATAKFSSYSIEDYKGHWVTIPESPVADGTRFIFEINSYRTVDPNNESNVLIIRKNYIREYMLLNIKVTVYAEELVGIDSANLIVKSNLQWVPSVSRLLIEPTTDSISLSDAISEIDTIGSSQIHDAVRMASQRIIDYQGEYTDWKDSKKVIFLLTDGDENTSQYSISQAINEVNSIDGSCGVPVIPIRLGYAYSSDEILMSKYSTLTCGSNKYLINATSSDIISVLNDILTDKVIKINDGYYTNTIDLGSDNLGNTVSLDTVVVPSGGRILFRVRFSSDQTSWSDWSDWYDSSETQSYSLSLQFKGRYFQYQVHLYGNENFETPILYAGATMCYYKAQKFTIFFHPVNLDIKTDEYLASIHISHKAELPETSFINYGYCQYDSTNISDYYGETRPFITTDRHSIILSRYNELFLTNNYQKYTAINGRWNENAQIEVYRVNVANPNGELVAPTDYAANSNDGTITFYNAQNKNDKFVLCVNFDPAFRITCNVTNYGPSAAAIDHIGVIYNVTKRIPINTNGSIIHTAINERV